MYLFGCSNDHTMTTELAYFNARQAERNKAEKEKVLKRKLEILYDLMEMYTKVFATETDNHEYSAVFLNGGLGLEYYKGLNIIHIGYLDIEIATVGRVLCCNSAEYMMYGVDNIPKVPKLTWRSETKGPWRDLVADLLNKQIEPMLEILKNCDPESKFEISNKQAGLYQGIQDDYRTSMDDTKLLNHFKPKPVKAIK